MKPTLHSSGDASRLNGVAPRTAAVRGHNMAICSLVAHLSDGRLTALGAYTGFHHGLLVGPIRRWCIIR